jgi:RNA polymerase sigma factor (sigma-70 family)
MSDQNRSFHVLIEQIQQGSQEAARELAETYGPHVQRYVRRQINRDLRNRFDSLDFVQLVWASFFCEPAKVPALQSPGQLIAYLGRMAQHKVIDEVRKQRSKKADVQREQRLPLVDETGQIRGRDPTPSAVAIFQEEFDALVTRQPATVGQVARLRYEGATYEEIAEELQISERHARRAIARLEAERTVERGDKPRDPPVPLRGGRVSGGP